jgi:serine/threonine-protein kinase RsbW
MGQVIEDITGAMTRQGFTADEVFGMRLAVEEAVVNAMKHGHQDQPDEPVSVRYQVSPERVLVEVEDRGPGFDPDQVADPLAPENLERPSGRGLLLMRTYTTWMRHNRRGNRVTLCKRKSRG